ncbi:MAG: FecR family protein [Draconibacterium sp.]
MNEKNNNDFLSLVRDEEFIQQVRESTDYNKLVLDLKEKYPDSQDIVSSVEFLRKNFSNNLKLAPQNFNNILTTIREYSRKQKLRKRRGFILSYRFWRAAVVLIVLSAGAILVKHQVDNNFQNKFAKLENTSDENQSLLLLSDGSKRVLKDNDSFIEYEKESNEVLVKKQNQEEERIVNQLNNEDGELNQVVVPYGQRQKIKLSDGTLVQLNAGSKLVFPASFSGKTREVYLKGEAYFEVNRNEKMPFIVKTEYVDVEVLGTVFDISAYSGDEFATTVLVEGKVKVVQKNKLMANHQYILNPGQGCFYSVDNQISEIKEVNIDEYVFWKDGYFQFKDMPLIQVVRRVKKYYNQSILIEGEELANVMISGKLVLSEDFQDVVQFLSKTIEGRCELNEQNTYILKQ